MRARTAVLPLAVLTALAACGGENDSAADHARPDLPETITDTLRLEGAPEPLTMHLFESPEGIVPGFHTYYPTDLVPEVERSAEGDAVRFTAEFGGVRNDDAFLHVLFYPPRMILDDAVSLARSFVASRTVGAARGVEFPARRPELPDRFPWAIYEDDFRFQTPEGDWLIGTIAVGRHDGRLFHVVLMHPEDYAEGFGPRAEHVVDEWVWADGTRLEASVAEAEPVR